MNKKQSFEIELQELEEIVAALEHGQLSLDDTLKMYEKGVSISRALEKKLNQAEEKLRVLQGGQVQEVELSDELS